MSSPYPENRQEEETFPQYEPLPLPEQPPETEQPPVPQGPSTMAQLGAAVREIAETILLTLVIFFLIRFAVENYRVEGQSMEPNFHNTEYLLVNKLSYKVGHPQRNDVIIFHFPLDETKNYIKRVIGLPGEKVEIRNGQVYINDVLVPEEYPIAHATYSYGPTVVPPDEYFVLGDNRPESSDSHFWGFVPMRDIVGKAWISYWPPSMWGIVPDFSPKNEPGTTNLTPQPPFPSASLHGSTTLAGKGVFSPLPF